MKLFGIDLSRKHIAIRLDENTGVLVMFRQGLFKGTYDVEYVIQSPATWRGEIDSTPGVLSGTAIREVAHAAKRQILKG